MTERARDVDRVDEAEEKVAEEIVRELLEHMGIAADVVAVDNPSTMALDAEDPPTIFIEILGQDLGMLIGRRGDHLSQLQYLVNLIANRRLETWTRVVVDVEGYRTRREESLIGLGGADRTAGRALAAADHPGANAAERAPNRPSHAARQSGCDHREQRRREHAPGHGAAACLTRPGRRLATILQRNRTGVGPGKSENAAGSLAAAAYHARRRQAWPQAAIAQPQPAAQGDAIRAGARLPGDRADCLRHPAGRARCPRRGRRSTRR